MPLLGTSASITAKGYGFALLGSVESDILLSGVNAQATVGTVKAFSPKPVPANQYWSAVAYNQAFPTDAFYSISLDVFRFDEVPSPSITTVSNPVSLGTIQPFRNTPLVVTNNGISYILIGHYVSGSTVFANARLVRFNLSTGIAPVITTVRTFTYDTTGSQRFINIQNALSVRPSGTQLALGVTFVNSSSQTQNDIFVYNINSDGTGSAFVNAINSLSTGTYFKQSVSINPKFEEILAIGGGLLSSSGTGYVWTYKNYGVSLQEVFAERLVNEAITGNATGNRVLSLQWSNSGLYLFAATTNDILIYKLNTSTAVLSLLAKFDIATFGAVWSVDDDSLLFSNGQCIVRTGDVFQLDTPVNAPGSSNGAFNYNGGYLLSVSASQTNNTNVRVYDYDGPNLAVPPVISANNNNRQYFTNSSGVHPRFDGEA